MIAPPQDSNYWDWRCPYPSNRAPVFGRNLVATSQPLATNAGLMALKAGGNAVDAALATAICLTVVEPNNNGIGSDAFAIVWDGKALHGLNASGRSPFAWSPDYFKQHTSMPSLGWNSVTVPGAVSAWVALSEKFGKLPFEDLFATAIHYARDGYQVGYKTGYFWQLAAQRYADYPEFCKTFLPGGQAPGVGQFITLPDHANTLEEIARTGGASFYTGRLAQSMAADSKAKGGALTLDDLAQHQVTWVPTISLPFLDTSLHEIPPNGQGLMALIALGIAKATGVTALPLDDPQSIHLQIEATRIAFAEVERHLADLAYMRIAPEDLIEPGYLESRAKQVDPNRANPNPTALGAGEDTVYLTTADADGMMVSMIQSNYRGFGSGIVVPGTGISLQNRGNGFTLEPGHPNEVAGGKRPFHTIIPGFVMQGDEPLMSFGVMGGHMQAQGHLQMMIRVILHHQNPQAASDAPRWHLREDGVVCLERGCPEQLVTSLRAKGHQVLLGEPEHLFGGAQLIVRLGEGYCAGSDHRKEGMASGY